MLYCGEHLARHAACLMEHYNIPTLRLDPGKWRQRMHLRFIFEDLRQARNRVLLSSEDPRVPEVRFEEHSEYTERGIRHLEKVLPKLLEPLPVERWKLLEDAIATEAHIMGTVVMGADPETSVVDGDCLHHEIRNLAVLGSSAFPTAAPANPTLTISAMAMRTARRLARGSEAVETQATPGDESTGTTASDEEHAP
jgi:choline dehydrogenase-like flavoprotein